MVADKMKLVQSLKDIAVTAKISKTDDNINVNEVDQKYEKLECKLTPIEKKSAKF